MTQSCVRPHHVIPQLLPVRPRPHRHERTGSYLIRLAQANHCPPWSFLRLLGRIPSADRADLLPTAAVTMNHAALTRLAAYLGKTAGELTRALPWITAEERWDEPTILIHRPTRTLLRSCHLCEKRAGGASLMPNPHPLQFTCLRHNTWLITDESIDLPSTPQVTAAIAALRKIRRQGDDLTHAHYQLIRKHLTDDCRGQGWHRHLTQRWIGRQRLQHPASNANDQFVRAHTQHWSMLPETTALIRLFMKVSHSDTTLLNTSETWRRRRPTSSLARRPSGARFWSPCSSEVFRAPGVPVTTYRFGTALALLLVGHTIDRRLAICAAGRSPSGTAGTSSSAASRWARRASQRSATGPLIADILRGCLVYPAA